MDEPGSKRADVVLVAMPWQAVSITPIQLGLLHAHLEKAGIAVASQSLNVRFLQYCLLRSLAELPEEDRITREDHSALEEAVSHTGEGEWVFAVPPFSSPDRDYFAFIAHGHEALEKLERLRSWAPDFLERCVAEIAAFSPAVVGFTLGIGQTIPSLVLARMLKDTDPSLKIVFGGSSCDGIMGQTLHRAYPWIDVVVRGEGEGVVAEVMSALIAGKEPPEVPGICFRRGAEQVVIDESPARFLPLDELAAPNYDEYFEAIADIESLDQWSVHLAVRTSRGCWWGRCTFCGLSRPEFESKSPEVVFEEVSALTERHRILRVMFVDWAIDKGYMTTLFPRMAQTGTDWSLFLETRASLSKDEMRLLKQAGAVTVQPGIESMSTPMLRLMQKGATSLQVIRFLKWARELDLEALWNLIYAFPDEPVEEYDRIIELIPHLHHLEPPMNALPMQVDRFNHYHRNIERYPGLGPLQPLYFHELYEQPPETLDDLVYRFTRRGDDLPYVEALRGAIDRWKARQTEGSQLWYELGPGFMRIMDSRDEESELYELEDLEAEIYRACDAGARPADIARTLEGQVDAEEVTDFLESLKESGLVFEEKGRYLSLATRGREWREFKT